MATKRKSGLIHCDNCGEYYSASYRRCPFCDEYDDEYEASDDPIPRPSEAAAESVWPSPTGGAADIPGPRR